MNELVKQVTKHVCERLDQFGLRTVKIVLTFDDDVKMRPCTHFLGFFIPNVSINSFRPQTLFQQFLSQRPVFGIVLFGLFLDNVHLLRGFTFSFLLLPPVDYFLGSFLKQCQIVIIISGTLFREKKYLNCTSTRGGQKSSTLIRTVENKQFH